MFDKFPAPLNPLYEELSKPEQMRLHRAYERAVDNGRIWRILAALFFVAAAVVVITLGHERRQVDGKIAEAKERVAKADARVLAMADQLVSK
jgi:hypothetical protein